MAATKTKRPATKAIEPTRFYTFREAATCLRVSIPWIYKQRDNGGLPITEVAGRVWIAGSDLIEFLKQHRKSTAS